MLRKPNVNKTEESSDSNSVEIGITDNSSSVSSVSESDKESDLVGDAESVNETVKSAKQPMSNTTTIVVALIAIMIVFYLLQFVKSLGNHESNVNATSAPTTVTTEVSSGTTE